MHSKNTERKKAEKTNIILHQVQQCAVKCIALLYTKMFTKIYTIISQQSCQDNRSNNYCLLKECIPSRSPRIKKVRKNTSWHTKSWRARWQHLQILPTYSRFHPSPGPSVYLCLQTMKKKSTLLPHYGYMTDHCSYTHKLAAVKFKPEKN